MTARNDITGDLIQSKLNSKAFEDNFDRIFGKKNKVDGANSTTDKPVEPVQLELDFGDEHRIDIIGQNGNDGNHYE